jgi:predicted  nucleic acid-binding Zn-ribbon protein
MDQELREYLDKQFKSVDERFESLETDVRHTKVIVEGLQGQIQLVAEGVANVDEKLDRFEAETAEEFKDVRATIRSLYTSSARRVSRPKTRAKKLGNA